MAKLDVAKFRKVRVLVTEGATMGERAAAMRQAAKIASKAGLTYDNACHVADGTSTPTPTQAAAKSFNDFFNTPEFRAERAERERKRLERCAELLKVYGSEQAVFAETGRERMLRLAVKPLAQWKTWTAGDGTRHRYISALDGWGSLASRKDMPESVRAAVSAALPLPPSVQGVWAEYKAAEQLRADRSKFVPEYEPELWITAREYVLEAALETMPATSVQDMLARIAWAASLAEHDAFRYHDEAFLSRTRSDLEGAMAGSLLAGGKHDG